MFRDFTYIDDVVENLYRLVKKPAKPNKEFNLSKPVYSSSWAPYQILNLGNSQSIKLRSLLYVILFNNKFNLLINLNKLM